MPYLTEFITVAVIHFLAVVSPGPDFVMISKNSLTYSRRAAVYSALGLGLGILVHVTYSLVGIGLLIAKSITLFNIIKYIGAAYLIYIGYQALKAKPNKNLSAELAFDEKSISAFGAVRMGFLTNVLNPKATLFFLALFTQVINPATPVLIQIFYGLEMALATFAWFAFVATVLSHRIVRLRFGKVQHYVERFFGAILITLGIKVALSSSK